MASAESITYAKSVINDLGTTPLRLILLTLLLFMVILKHQLRGLVMLLLA